MAATPEEALLDAINAAGSLKLKQFRDTVHLPMHQIGMPEGFPPSTSPKKMCPSIATRAGKKQTQNGLGVV
jgi:hypothetical protein